jgi:hypothetical protein
LKPTPYVASLRIYEPLSAFESVDQIRWQSIDASIDSRSEEQALALRRLIFPEPPAVRPDGAHVLDINGVRYVSPWSTATRCWAALDDFKESLPSSITPFFIPPSLEEVITTGVDLLEDRVPHIITENWVIPPRWFSLFTTDERVRGEDSDGPYCFARTTMAKARERALHSHEVVLGAFGQGPVEQEIENLADWLELFHSESLVELDYGGLASIIDSALRAQGLDGIIDDSSIEDVALSLSGLSAGDGAVAGQGYERLVTRWRAVQAYESAI